MTFGRVTEEASGGSTWLGKVYRDKQGTFCAFLVSNRFRGKPSCYKPEIPKSNSISTATKLLTTKWGNFVANTNLTKPLTLK